MARKTSDAKRDLAGLAQGHAQAAIDALVDIAQSGNSEAARISAAVALLDRAYGRPAQAADGADDDKTAPALHIEINTREAVGDVRVTRTE